MHVVVVLMVVQRLHRRNRLAHGCLRGCPRSTARRWCGHGHLRRPVDLRRGGGRRLGCVVIISVLGAGLVVVGCWMPCRCCRGRLYRMVMAFGVFCFGSVMMGSCLSVFRPVVAVAQARGRPHRGRQRDDPDRAEKHHGAAERRQRLTAQAAVPHPAGAHHDIDLQHERAQVRGLHHLGLPCMRTKRRSGSSRHRPQRDDSDVEKDAGRKHRVCSAHHNKPGPKHLENRNASEERTGWHPLLPVSGNNGKVNNGSTQRGERGESSRKPAVCLPRCPRRHRIRMTGPSPKVVV